VLARSTHLYRLLDLLFDPETFRAERADGAIRMTSNDLEALRLATSIEGESSQAFALVQALAKGPAPEVALPRLVPKRKEAAA
jgi:hypothetical protein